MRSAGSDVVKIKSEQTEPAITEKAAQPVERKKFFKLTKLCIALSSVWFLFTAAGIVIGAMIGVNSSGGFQGLLSPEGIYGAIGLIYALCLAIGLLPGKQIKQFNQTGKFNYKKINICAVFSLLSFFGTFISLATQIDESSILLIIPLILLDLILLGLSYAVFKANYSLWQGAKK